MEKHRQMMIDFNSIQKFYKIHPHFAIAYGGDGTVLNVIKDNPNKTIIPIRNYGLCEKHKQMYNMLLSDDVNMQHRIIKNIDHTTCNYLKWTFANNSQKGISEIVVKNCDPTSAIRFNLSVNGSYIVKNAIADGLIASTTYGSTGYFKSISRCSFNCAGIGLAFIAPMQNLSTGIYSIESQIDIEFVRNASIIITADKSTEQLDVSANDVIHISQMTDNAAELIGLKDFHCNQCRMLRHAANENGDIIEDLYIK